MQSDMTFNGRHATKNRIKNSHYSWVSSQELVTLSAGRCTSYTSSLSRDSRTSTNPSPPPFDSGNMGIRERYLESRREHFRKALQKEGSGSFFTMRSFPPGRRFDSERQTITNPGDTPGS
ncbi:hypothetical protein NPIL_155591 [Nephila pilipes]|uniref:Uncharacterized protein n=1 Tax=Nephila pilipes TaxID=299642 RepID=A0A8X6U8V6_NEPPI|nr:hypothetical protein NPIL_155591 [Nephila pilipes]